MICPLLNIVIPWTIPRSEERPIDCLEEECAWWVETQDRCAVKDIALSLGFISMDIAQILEKMPSPEFFKK